jgi:hypothetical protein
MAKGPKARSDQPTLSAVADLRLPNAFDDSSGAARVSSDVSLPTQMANGAFVVQLLFPPAFAIGAQRRPTACEYLGCLRVGQADRTRTLRAGNLHGIPSTALPYSRRCFPTALRPNQQLHLPTKLDCLPTHLRSMGWGPVHENV